ncbi:hypothetical protein [Streptomyces sp. I05A-00742]|uniref:hypothetical protein n=1 Tax=Streptomyces sp. I05A-00742 TaxID=2732853 RepID=UPI002018211D|nr:hypothetical protein [Streptomyces sp. I05A-00742]
MSHAVLALGVVVLCVSGCVWYLPAVTDIRAGVDRPRSRRLAAAACLTGWGTAALLAPLLLAGAPWPTIGAVAAAGAAVCAGLRSRSLVERGRERRETGRHWAVLGGPLPGEPARPRRAFLCWLLPGPAAAVAAFAAVLAGGGTPNGARFAAAVAVGASVTLLFLGLAGVRAHAAARRG